MRVLIATKSDFCWTEEGELVQPSSECSREPVDGGCGCRRSMSGLKTHKATTTFRVAEMEVDLLAEVGASLKAAGWPVEWAEGVAREITHIAEFFPVGTLLEKRGTKVQVRA